MVLNTLNSILSSGEMLLQNVVTDSIMVDNVVATAPICCTTNYYLIAASLVVIVVLAILYIMNIFKVKRYREEIGDLSCEIDELKSKSVNHNIELHSLYQQGMDQATLNDIKVVEKEYFDRFEITTHDVYQDTNPSQLFDLLVKRVVRDFQTIKRQNSELLRDCRTLENEIQQQRNKINILQDTLSKGNGSDREFFVQKFLVQLNKVACYIEEVYNDVVKKSGEENLYANTIRSVLGSFTTMRLSIEQRKDRWSNLSLDSVYYELQTLAKDGITQDGWVNILNYLDLYAAATRDLADGFRQHGVSLSKLGVLVSEVNTLMGWCGISVIKPHLLVEEFDPAYHSYVNADQWIEYFDKDINSRDYQGRVFDVSCIGYTIDKEVKKSEVFYI